MSKDVSFLFNTADWIGGTLTFTRAHKGAYMDLLMAQHNFGHMNLNDIETILGLDFESMWESKLKSKFITDSDGLFYNKRLENEIIKRSKFKQSRKNNLSSTKKTAQHMESHMEAHMEGDMNAHMNAHLENDNVLYNVDNINNIIINNNTNKGGVGEKKTPIEKTWRNDFQIYLDQLNVVYKNLINDQDFIQKQERFYPSVNIALSIEKAVTNFWGKEAGWKNKKSSRTKDIDWEATLVNAIGLNKVYKPSRPTQTVENQKATVSNILQSINQEKNQVTELNPKVIEYR